MSIETVKRRHLLARPLEHDDWPFNLYELQDKTVGIYAKKTLYRREFITPESNTFVLSQLMTTNDNQRVEHFLYISDEYYFFRFGFSWPKIGRIANTANYRLSGTFVVDKVLRIVE